MKKLKVVSDTQFKQRPELSNNLSRQEKVFVPNGTGFDLTTSDVVRGGHLKVTLTKPLGPAQQTVWYVYKPDVRVYDTNIKLTIVSDTLFKQRPVLSTQLSEREKFFVPNGTEYYLQSYLPAEGQHVRIAIANAFLGPENRTTWYAYKPDIRIVGDTITLTVTSDTLFKTSPQLSSKLSNSDKVFVKNTTELELISHELAPSNHVKLELAEPSFNNRSELIWYAYKPDIQIEGNEKENQPKNETPRPKPSGPYVKLPGFQGNFYLSNPIIPGGNFTWGEATHGGSRIPVNRNVVYGIIRIARVMEEVRDRLGGRPITINSWYRDPVTNRRVGGASRSRHLNGDAVDFVAPGLHPYDVYDRLNRWWGSKGGLASATVFTHIDARGYYARWSYGF
ncbi:D-Ala-D-Ala carboxypeptidase family metallohydrolase [Leptothoe spongobia]|uniref:Peptidase M15 family protein n=1 Tax=Leptothoe spongobia TAU-MAC 1115 TaxID=1967444 RepID=A0A947DF39_9CYAN|nr:D-Ala-D-Ala carboxypeptidase family metallohydrolase [Leptothoe spongobia]MBT9315408.1 peptidase M15 family protein [Leptothoe spongobia TAU-MAC 1115]